MNENRCAEYGIDIDRIIVAKSTMNIYPRLQSLPLHRFFHSFFWTDAALLFPKMNAEVRLSAPVLLEVEPDPANTTFKV